MTRPSCVVQVWDLPGEKRPRFTAPAGVGSIVRAVSDTAGLTRMGVSVRIVQPGLAGSNRHFHMVEEEWTYVVAGRGTVRIGRHRLPVRAGSFVGFPPGPRPHHLLAEGDAPLEVLEGGERRRQEDYGCYPDLGKRFSFHAGIEPWTDPLPPEEGDASQCMHIDDLTPFEIQHDVDPQARRTMRILHWPSGLKRQAVYWAHVEPGAHTTAFHSHAHTDEWIFVLAGRARARVGDVVFEVGAHDFLAHPAGGAAHLMEAIEPLTYLVGGEIDPDDVVVYPDAQLRCVHGTLEPVP
jgi:uncharacterized cupin superfamily protein